MAKITGGLMSMSARGSIGKSIVYSSWKGVDYARQHVIPKNPKSTGQMITRNTFSWLHDVYKQSPGIMREPWEQLAKTRAWTGSNAWMNANMSQLRGQTDLSAITLCEGANGGIPPTGITVTPGSHSLTITTTNPTAPVDWTLVAMQAAVIRDEAPTGDVTELVHAAEDTSTFDTVTITGLTASQLYQVAAWLKWTKPDGKTAWSSAFTSTGTPTT